MAFKTLITALALAAPSLAHPEGGTLIHHHHEHAKRAPEPSVQAITATINGKAATWTTSFGDQATGAPASGGSGSNSNNGNANANAPVAADFNAAGEDLNQGVGHMGSTGSSAITLVPNTDGHAYTMQVKSTASSPRKMYVWNKVGADGGANSGQTSGTPTHQFELQPGQSQVIAFAPNTQGALCDYTNGKQGEGNTFACPTVEFNFAPRQDDGSTGGTGYDVSMINLNAVGGGACNVAVDAPDVPGAVKSTCTSNMFSQKDQSSSNSHGFVMNPSAAHLVTYVSDP